MYHSLIGKVYGYYASSPTNNFMGSATKIVVPRRVNIFFFEKITHTKKYMNYMVNHLLRNLLIRAESKCWEILEGLRKGNW